MIGGRNQIKNLDRPEYKIPDEILKAVEISRANAADPRFAGQSNLERQVALNQANALNAAASAGKGMYQVNAIQAQANQAAQNIGAEQARQDRQDRADLSNMLGVLAKYKDQEWQMNKFAPYQDKYNEGRERIGAGMENIYGGLDNAALIATRLLSATQGQGGFADANAIPSAAAAGTQNMQRSDYLDSQIANFMRRIATVANNGVNQIYNAVR